jgi:phosphopantetheinyl transferase
VHPFKPNRRIDGTRYLPRFNESPEAQIERIQAAQAKRERRQARNLILRIGFNRETHYAK